MAADVKQLIFIAAFGLALLYLMSSIGALDLVLDMAERAYEDKYGAGSWNFNISAPSITNVIYLFLIVFGLVLLGGAVMLGRPNQQTIVWYVLLAVGLSYAFMKFPEYLPADLSVLARGAQAAIGFG